MFLNRGKQVSMLVCRLFVNVASVKKALILFWGVVFFGRVENKTTMVNETFNILKSYEKQKNDVKPENLSDTSWAAGYQRVLN